MARRQQDTRANRADSAAVNGYPLLRVTRTREDNAQGRVSSEQGLRSFSAQQQPELDAAEVVSLPGRTSGGTLALATVGPPREYSRLYSAPRRTHGDTAAPAGMPVPTHGGSQALGALGPTSADTSCPDQTPQQTEEGNNSRERSVNPDQRVCVCPNRGINPAQRFYSDRESNPDGRDRRERLGRGLNQDHGESAVRTARSVRRDNPVRTDYPLRPTREASSTEQARSLPVLGPDALHNNHGCSSLPASSTVSLRPYNWSMCCPGLYIIFVWKKFKDPLLKDIPSVYDSVGNLRTRLDDLGFRGVVYKEIEEEDVLKNIDEFLRRNKIYLWDNNDPTECVYVHFASHGAKNRIFCSKQNSYVELSSVISFLEGLKVLKNKLKIVTQDTCQSLLRDSTRQEVHLPCKTTDVLVYQSALWDHSAFLSRKLGALFTHFIAESLDKYAGRDLAAQEQNSDLATIIQHAGKKTREEYQRLVQRDLGCSSGNCSRNHHCVERGVCAADTSPVCFAINTTFGGSLLPRRNGLIS